MCDKHNESVVSNSNLMLRQSVEQMTPEGVLVAFRFHQVEPIKVMNEGSSDMTCDVGS